MIAFGIGFWLLALGWILPAAFRKTDEVNRVGMAVGLAGDFFLLLSGISGALTPQGNEVYTTLWRLPTGVAGTAGAATVSLSPLQGFFLSIIALVSALACIYARGYLNRYKASPGKFVRHWFLFNLLTASMALVVAAADAGTFMLAWEAMSVSSFFLVAFSSEKPENRRASWLYLVFTHVGAAFLLVMFSVLAKSAGSMEFAAFRALAPKLSPGTSVWVFLLAIAGFGMKAGFFPAHVWLPEAHPAAPSHVSAIMSGVMIKVAVYGILLTLSFVGGLQEWEGWLVLLVGAASGVWGILMSISRQNLKGMLAYSSVENMGIIGIAIGIGVLGKAIGSPALAFFGFAGALLHTLNHSLFKSLLFFGAGALQVGAGTLDIDRMGGLLGKMPRTATLIILGSVAIAGLPPLNGFAGEFLLYSAAIGASFGSPLGASVFSIVVILSLSAIGALALYAFAKFIGVALLGEPRSPESAGAVEPSPLLYWPMGILALLCLASGFFPGAILSALALPLGALGLDMGLFADWLGGIRGNFAAIETLSLALLTLVGVLHLLREKALSRREVEVGETWACGYDKVDSRMQYTASSFAQPILSFSKPLAGKRASESFDKSFFPAGGSLKTAHKDPFMDSIASAYRRLQDFFLKLKVIQHGNVHFYVLYIVAALIFALLWGLAL